MHSSRSLFVLALFAVAPWIAACDDSNPVAPGTDAAAPGGPGERTAAVSVVDAAKGTIRLTDGTTVSIPGNDVIDPTGDLFTLEAVEEAVRAGRRVRVEIELVSEGGTLVVVRARFEIDEADDDFDDDGDDDGFDDEVEGAVSAVDVAARTVTLAGGTTFLVPSDDLIERDGDLLSLDSVAVALADGQNVRAEADVVRDGDGLRATSAKFEVDEDDRDGDDDNDDNGDDDGFDDEIEGAVTGVDPAARTVTLAGGTTFLVPSDDLIERDGDLLSLDSVAVALADGQNVRAEADVVRDGDGLRATSAKFEVDEDDDDEGGDD